MEFCYQLSKSPPTYDFLMFLWYVEQMRKDWGKQSLQIRIVKGNRQRVARDVVFNAERKEWRVRNMLAPMAWLMPSVTEVSIVEHGIQTVGYNMPRISITEPCLRASKQATLIVHEYLERMRRKGFKRPVCIPIREYNYQPERNNNHVQWSLVMEWLVSNGYSPIVVPDTEALMNGSHHWMGLREYSAAAMSPDIRLALMEQCHTSLILNQGPGMMALLGNVDCFLFYHDHKHLESCTESYYRKSQLTPDADWGPGKRIVWCDDKADQIIAAIEPHLSMREAA